jgi:hypothetical protein
MQFLILKLILLEWSNFGGHKIFRISSLSDESLKYAIRSKKPIANQITFLQIRILFLCMKFLILKFNLLRNRIVTLWWQSVFFDEFLKYEIKIVQTLQHFL